MKLGILKSVGHNLADSVSSGIGLMIGVNTPDIYEEAAAAPEGFIEVDFLTGLTEGGEPSASLSRAIRLYSEALPALRARHGIEPAALRQLKVRFSGRGILRRFVVSVEDRKGKRSVDEYSGFGGRRVKALDRLGRIRPK